MALNWVLSRHSDRCLIHFLQKNEGVGRKELGFPALNLEGWQNWYLIPIRCFALGYFNVSVSISKEGQVKSSMNHTSLKVTKMASIPYCGYFIYKNRKIII